MNDLEQRLRASLDRHIGGPQPRTITDEARTRIGRARRRLYLSAGVLLVFVVGLVAAGLQLAPQFEAQPASGGQWPVVTAGDPRDAYLSTEEPRDIVGLRYAVSSGTVDGMPYSLDAWTSRTGYGTAPAPCLDLAGPAQPGAVGQSPGPVAPGATAALGGVGGFCAPDARYLNGNPEWPKFPAGSDLFVRTWAPAGTGDGIFAGMGFVTERVHAVTITLADGSVHDVPVLRWPNAWNVGAILYFQPRTMDGTLRAYDRSGALLASAPICNTPQCDVLDVQQIVPTDPVQAATIDAPVFPYFAATGDWPTVEPLDEAQRPEQDRFAAGDATALVWGRANGIPFDAPADPSGSIGCPNGTRFQTSFTLSDGATSSAPLCSSLAGVPTDAGWSFSFDPNVVDHATVLSGVVSARYDGVRVTLQDGSTQLLRLFEDPNGTGLRFFMAIVPDDQSGSVAFAQRGVDVVAQQYDPSSSTDTFSDGGKS